MSKVHKARITPEYRLGYVEAIQHVTGAHVMSVCKEYLKTEIEERPARELAQFLVDSLGTVRKQYGIKDSWMGTSRKDRDRFARKVLKAK